MAKRTEQEWINEWSYRINPDYKAIIRKYQHKFPIDILQLSKELGVNVYKPYINTKIEGWIEYNEENDNFEIFLNPQYPAKKQRYTLAHEVAHFLFHQHIIKEEGQLDRAYLSSSYFDKKEWQANLYASELLVPTNSINADIDENSDLLDLDKLTKHIVEKYNVSTAVAMKRARRALRALELEN